MVHPRSINMRFANSASPTLSFCDSPYIPITYHISPFHQFSPQNAYLIDALGIHNVPPEFLSQLNSLITQYYLEQQLGLPLGTHFDPSLFDSHLDQPQIYFSLWTSTDPSARPFALSTPTPLSHQPLCHLASPPSDLFQLLEMPQIDNPLYNSLYIKLHITNIPSIALLTTLQQQLYDLDPNLAYYNPSQQHKCHCCTPHSNASVHKPQSSFENNDLMQQLTFPTPSTQSSPPSALTAPSPPQTSRNQQPQPPTHWTCHLDPVLLQTELNFKTITPYRSDYLPLLSKLPLNSRILLYINSTVYFIVPETELRLLHLQLQITSIQYLLLKTPTDSALALALDGFYTDYAFLQCKHLAITYYLEQRAHFKSNFLESLDTFPDLYEKLKALPFPLPREDDIRTTPQITNKSTASTQSESNSASTPSDSTQTSAALSKGEDLGEQIPETTSFSKFMSSDPEPLEDQPSAQSLTTSKPESPGKPDHCVQDGQGDSKQGEAQNAKTPSNVGETAQNLDIIEDVDVLDLNPKGRGRSTHTLDPQREVPSHSSSNQSYRTADSNSPLSHATTAPKMSSQDENSESSNNLDNEENHGEPTNDLSQAGEISNDTQSSDESRSNGADLSEVDPNRTDIISSPPTQPIHAHTSDFQPALADTTRFDPSSAQSSRNPQTSAESASIAAKLESLPEKLDLTALQYQFPPGALLYGETHTNSILHQIKSHSTVKNHLSQRLQQLRQQQLSLHQSISTQNSLNQPNSAFSSPSLPTTSQSLQTAPLLNQQLTVNTGGQREHVNMQQWDAAASNSTNPVEKLANSQYSSGSDQSGPISIIGAANQGNLSESIPTSVVLSPTTTVQPRRPAQLFNYQNSVMFNVMQGSSAQAPGQLASLFNNPNINNITNSSNQSISSDLRASMTMSASTVCMMDSTISNQQQQAQSLTQQQTPHFLANTTSSSERDKEIITNKHIFNPSSSNSTTPRDDPFDNIDATGSATAGSSGVGQSSIPSSSSTNSTLSNFPTHASPSSMTSLQSTNAVNSTRPQNIASSSSNDRHINRNDSGSSVNIDSAQNTQSPPSQSTPSSHPTSRTLSTPILPQDSLSPPSNANSSHFPSSLLQNLSYLPSSLLNQSSSSLLHMSTLPFNNTSSNPPTPTTNQSALAFPAQSNTTNNTPNNENQPSRSLKSLSTTTNASQAQPQHQPTLSTTSLLLPFTTQTQPHQNPLSALPTYAEIAQNPLQYLHSLPPPTSITPIIPPSIFTRCNILDFETSHLLTTPLISPLANLANINPRSSLLAHALNSSVSLQNQQNHALSTPSQTPSRSQSQTPNQYINNQIALQKHSTSNQSGSLPGSQTPTSATPGTPNVVSSSFTSNLLLPSTINEIDESITTPASRRSQPSSSALSIETSSTSALPTDPVESAKSRHELTLQSGRSSQRSSNLGGVGGTSSSSSASILNTDNPPSLNLNTSQVDNFNNTSSSLTLLPPDIPSTPGPSSSSMATSYVNNPAMSPLFTSNPVSTHSSPHNASIPSLSLSIHQPQSQLLPFQQQQQQQKTLSLRDSQALGTPLPMSPNPPPNTAFGVSKVSSKAKRLLGADKTSASALLNKAKQPATLSRPKKFGTSADPQHTSLNAQSRRPFEAMVQRLYTMYHFDGVSQLAIPLLRGFRCAPHLRYGSDGGPSLTPGNAASAIAARRGRMNGNNEQRSVQSVLDTATAVTLTAAIVSSKIKIFRILQQQIQLIQLSGKVIDTTRMDFFNNIKNRINMLVPGDKSGCIDDNTNTPSNSQSPAQNNDSNGTNQDNAHKNDKIGDKQLQNSQTKSNSASIQPIKRIPSISLHSLAAPPPKPNAQYDLQTILDSHQRDDLTQFKDATQPKEQLLLLPISVNTSTSIEQQSPPAEPSLTFLSHTQLSDKLTTLNTLLAKPRELLTDDDIQALNQFKTSSFPTARNQTQDQLPNLDPLALQQESHIVNISRDVVYRLRQQVQQQRQIVQQKRDLISKGLVEGEKTEHMLRFHSQYLISTVDNFSHCQLPAYNRTLEQLYQTNIRVQYRRSKLIQGLSRILPILSHHSESCKTRLTSILFPTLYESRHQNLNASGLTASQATLNAISNDQVEHRLAQSAQVNPGKKSRFSSMLSSISLLSTTNASINNKIFSATAGAGKRNPQSIDIYHTDLSKLSKSQQEQIRAKHALFQSHFDKYVALYGHQVYSICNIPLFLSPILLTDISVHDLLTQTAIALGYIAQLVNTLADYLQIKLRYPLFPNGPRSGVYLNFPDRCSILPLYCMSVSEKSFLPERHTNFLLIHLQAMELPLHLLYPHSTLYPMSNSHSESNSINAAAAGVNTSAPSLSAHYTANGVASSIADFPTTTTFSTSGQLVMNQSIYSTTDESSMFETNSNSGNSTDQSQLQSQSTATESRQPTNPAVTATPSKRDRKEAQIAAALALQKHNEKQMVDPTLTLPIEQRLFLSAIFLLNLNVLQLLSATLQTSQLNDPTHFDLSSSNNPFLSIEQQTSETQSVNLFSPSAAQHRHICSTSFSNYTSTTPNHIPPSHQQVQQIQPPSQTHYLAPPLALQSLYADSTSATQYNLFHYMTDHQAVLESYQRDITARLHVMRNEGRIATLLPFKTHSAHLLENIMLLIQILAPSS